MTRPGSVSAALSPANSRSTIRCTTSRGVKCLPRFRSTVRRIDGSVLRRSLPCRCSTPGRGACRSRRTLRGSGKDNGHRGGRTVAEATIGVALVRGGEESGSRRSQDWSAGFSGKTGLTGTAAPWSRTSRPRAGRRCGRGGATCVPARTPSSPAAGGSRPSGGAGVVGRQTSARIPPLW